MSGFLRNCREACVWGREKGVKSSLAAQAKKVDHKFWQPHKFISGSKKTETYTQWLPDKPRLNQSCLPGVSRELMGR